MNIIYSTEEEKIEREKAENLTIAEIREKIIEMTDGFPNKDFLQYIYKKEVLVRLRLYILIFTIP